MSTATGQSLIDDVRSILRSAGAPFTAKELRETLGDDVPAGSVSTTLHALVSRGEVVHDKDAFPGTYTLATSASRKSAATSAPALAAAPPPAPAEAPPAPAQAATGGARERKPRATKPKGAGKRQAQKRTPPAPAEVGLGRRATRKQLRTAAPASAPVDTASQAGPAPKDRRHVVAIPTADTPAAEQLVRLAACVIATWPTALDDMPAQLAAQCNRALALRKAA